jgi:hypothetical protein
MRIPGMTRVLESLVIREIGTNYALDNHRHLMRPLVAGDGDFLHYGGIYSHPSDCGSGHFHY